VIGFAKPANPVAVLRCTKCGPLAGHEHADSTPKMAWRCEHQRDVPKIDLDSYIVRVVASAPPLRSSDIEQLRMMLPEPEDLAA
jgi:hypothetical protein